MLTIILLKSKDSKTCSKVQLCLKFHRQIWSITPDVIGYGKMQIYTISERPFLSQKLLNKLTVMPWLRLGIWLSQTCSTHQLFNQIRLRWPLEVQPMLSAGLTNSNESSLPTYKRETAPILGQYNGQHQARQLLHPSLLRPSRFWSISKTSMLLL